MKVCKCGYRFSDDEKECPVCGESIKEAHEEQDGSPFSVLGGNTQNTEPKTASDTDHDENKQEEKAAVDLSPHAGEDDVAPISALFDGERDAVKKGDSKKAPVKKPERPKAGPNVDVQQVANAQKEAKFDPMKTPPPVDSPFSLLKTGVTALAVFFLLIPVIGFIYALVLTLGGSKKENMRTLGTAFLIAFMIQIVLVAAAMLVLALLFEVQFNRLIEIIVYTFNTFVSLIKTM